MSHQLLGDLHEVLLAHHASDQVQRSETDGVVAIIKALHDKVPAEGKRKEQMKSNIHVLS